jgi:hypothetical protein
MWPPAFNGPSEATSPVDVGRSLLPPKDQLDYFTKAGTALLLLLALPWLLVQLVKRPRYVIKNAGRHHLG